MPCYSPDCDLLRISIPLLGLFSSDLDWTHPPVVPCFDHPTPSLSRKHDLLLLARWSILDLVKSNHALLCLRCTYKDRWPIAEHVISIEQVVIMLPDLFARRAVDARWQVFPKLRFGYKYDREWKNG